jgi:alginate O-acetyltransferase complex protein AlgI
MTPGNVIELNRIDFWLLCIVAVVVLAPLTHCGLRKWVFAGLNWTFLALLLHSYALGVGAAVLVSYLLLKLVERWRWRWVIAGLTGLLLVCLFAVHKLPGLASGLRLDAVAQILSIIGFSYASLRLCEVLRAVYEGRHPAPDALALSNYLLPFHMLAAGPVQAYDDFVQQPTVPKLKTPAEVLAGVERIAGGVFKKFVLALLLQKLFLTDLQASGMYFLLELQVLFIWIYLDFSAYSDIAVGIGTLMGVATPENFDRPLLARNLIDFWQRWHMSLSFFIRRNLFIPIQVFLMRRTDARWPLLCASAAVAVSFILCGLWHGLGFGFLAWGGMQAAGLVAVHVYDSWLRKRLGSKGLKAYRANPWIRRLAVCLTFEFEAVSVLTLFLK